MNASVMEQLHKVFSGKKILVVGLGLQGGGVGLARFFCELGAIVTVTDLKSEQQLQNSITALRGLQIRFVLGKHESSDFINSDFIFKAPKMRWDNPLIVAAIKQGVAVEMELSFFLKYCPAQTIGITGSRGKTTTTTMIYELLKSQGLSVHLAGNIPQSSTITLLKTLTERDVVVLELSSWQLSDFHHNHISPHIAVFTSFYPDHLDYYTSMDEYLYDKKAIFQYQKKDDYFVANKQVKEYLKDDHMISRVSYYDASDFPENLKFLKGEHNKENAAAALKVADIMGIPEDKSVKFISQFSGVPFRQELVREKDTVQFINDTTSTTPIATVKAIESFNIKPIILILGGNSKKLPYDQLLESLKRVNYIVLLSGTFTDQILPTLKEQYGSNISKVFDNIKEAVQAAYEKAQSLQKPCYILFSPGATSFAMFNNEFHRGEEFNQIVQSL